MSLPGHHTTPLLEAAEYTSPGPDVQLGEQLERLWHNSAFFRSKLEQAGYRTGLPVNRGWLRHVPLTDKAELVLAESRAKEASPPLVGANQCVTRDELVRITYSGGTSSTHPRPIGWTQQDADDYSEMGARALRIAGVRREHVVVNCFNYRLYAGGVMDQMSFERLGASVISYGVGDSRGLLQLLDSLPGPLCLYCTPSYAMRLAHLARQEGIQLGSLGVDLGIFSGEAGLQHASVRDMVEADWGMVARNLYGIAELGVQCADTAAHDALHYTASDFVHVELVDPTTLENIPWKAGVTGELVFTTLRRQACPLLRYRSHDVVRIRSVGSRKANLVGDAPSFTFDHLHRNDDMVKVNGVSIYAGDIQQLLIRLMEPTLTHNFQVELFSGTGSLDASLHIESSPLSLKKERTLRRVLELRLREELHFAPSILFVPANAFEGENKVSKLRSATQ